MGETYRKKAVLTRVGVAVAGGALLTTALTACDGSGGEDAA
ncbi:hypothetical protein [Streptomyces sp. NPDC002133]